MSKSTPTAKGKPRPSSWQPTRVKEQPEYLLDRKVCNRPALKLELKCGDFKIYRYIAAGMPVIKDSGRTLFDLAKVHEWLLSRATSAPTVHEFKGRAQRQRAAG